MYHFKPKQFQDFYLTEFNVTDNYDEGQYRDIERNLLKIMDEEEEAITYSAKTTRNLIFLIFKKYST